MIADPLDQQWATSPQAAQSKVANETILLHLESGTYFGLDPLGSRIWQGLKDGQGLRQLSAAIAGDHGVGLDRVEDDVRMFVGELLEHGLIEAR